MQEGLEQASGIPTEGMMAGELRQNVLSTDVVKPSERFDYWHSVICRHFALADSGKSFPGTFDAALTFNKLGSFEIGLLAAPQHFWVRERGHIRTDDYDDFLLSLIVEGDGFLSQNGQTLHQKSGDVVLYDTRKPFNYEITAKTIVFRIKRNELISHVASAEAMCMRSLGGGSPLRSIVAQALVCGVEASGRLAEDATAKAHLGASIFNLVLAILDLDADPAANSLTIAQGAQFERLRRFIFAHLSDGDLSCRMMAEYAGMSLRTLNRLFAELGTTPMRWVWRQRLDAAKREIAEGRVHNVTDAALRSGFNELSHFSRSFKAEFGVSPRLLLQKPPTTRPVAGQKFVLG